ARARRSECPRGILARGQQLRLLVRQRKPHRPGLLLVRRTRTAGLQGGEDPPSGGLLQRRVLQLPPAVRRCTADGRSAWSRAGVSAKHVRGGSDTGTVGSGRPGKSTPPAMKARLLVSSMSGIEQEARRSGEFVS